MADSEVARLRERLELEHQACVWALTALTSGNAQHRFITARFRQMDTCCERLSELVGEEQATTVLCDVFDGKRSQSAHPERSAPAQEGQ